jgi:hypothetical protein
VYALAGAAAGLGYLFVLSRFTKQVTGGGFSTRTAVFAFVQFLIPLATLLLFALINEDSVLWVAVSMVASLLAGSVIRFVLVGRKKGSDKGND